MVLTSTTVAAAVQHALQPELTFQVKAVPAWLSTFPTWRHSLHSNCTVPCATGAVHSMALGCQQLGSTKHASSGCLSHLMLACITTQCSSDDGLLPASLDSSTEQTHGIQHMWLPLVDRSYIHSACIKGFIRDPGGRIASDFVRS